MAEPKNTKISKQDLQSFLLTKDLPYNLDAEKSVISAVVINPENLDKIADIIVPDDFYYRPHRLVFAALNDLYQNNRRIDIVILHEYLEGKDQLKDAGGSAYLLQLHDVIPAFGLLLDHAKIIKDKATLRQLIEAASQAIAMSCDSKGRDVQEVLDLTERKIFQITNRVSQKDFLPISQLLKPTFQRISEINLKQGAVTGISTGFSEFDMMTSGLQKGDLIILAARPSMGKTALALNMAMNAWKDGAPVGIFSLEMPSEQLVLRMVSSESGVPHHKIRSGNISSEEWVEITNTAAIMDEAQIFIDDTPSLSIMELRAKARRLKLKHDIGLLVVDYLQLITVDQRTENRTQEIAMISRSLKGLAKELGVPILALSQLSRSLESRMEKRPMLSDLRESGAIEQDADLVCFIYRDVVYHHETDHPDAAEIIIGKQRNGPTGVVHVRYEGENMRFADAPMS